MFSTRIARSALTRSIRLQPSTIRPLSTTSTLLASTDQSHATDPNNASYVPKKAQEILPKGVEDAVPNKVHDTGKDGSKSHATGPSLVPEGIQEVAPEALEKALPEAIHPTEGKEKETGIKSNDTTGRF